MKINCICRQQYNKDDSKRNVEFLTIDSGWSEISEYAAIFTDAHAKYLTEQFQAKHKHEKVDFFARDYITL